ncbi:GntR family transcriptional regulator [Deinococcus rubellus]|uniref:GntR family transcriptional regulator n=1 Tax=Deinococcus rubellus TaxID=1889240 RepID=UPI0031EE7B1C
MLNMVAAPIARSSATLSAQAYHAIRRAILRREIAPGEKLNVRQLSERLSLSGTPIKEALLALSQEGLVTSLPRRGYFVPALDSAEQRELYLLRSVIEGLGARLAAQELASDLETRLGHLLTQLERAAETEDIEQYGQLDFELHQAIWEASQSPRLIKLAETLSGQIRLLMSRSNTLQGRLPSSLAEHRRIVTAIVSRDEGEAEREMRAHLEQAAQLMNREADPPSPAEPQRSPSRPTEPKPSPPRRL